MQIGIIDGATRTIGKQQGYIGLPLRDTVLRDKVSGNDVNVMESAWILEEDEYERLKYGAPLVLRLYGTQHPPVMLYVDKLDEDKSAEQIAAAHKRVAALKELQDVNSSLNTAFKKFRETRSMTQEEMIDVFTLAFKAIAEVADL